MCGFIVYPLSSPPPPHERLVRRRGPDAQNMEVINGFVFLHFLLHVTGQMCIQPFIEGSVVAVYNGELYGFQFQRSDGENILPLYKAYGSDMVRFLDGEYAIAIYDFSLKKALFITDPFGTKPLWVHGLSCASYESALSGGVPLPPNTWLEVSFDGSCTRTGSVIEFDFDNQIKGNFDDWDNAYAEAIRKRAIPVGLFLPLSSGYDSGVIACELLRQDVPFRSFSIAGEEDLAVLAERIRLTDGTELTPTLKEYIETVRFLKYEAEPVSYDHLSDVHLHCDSFLDDSGAIGLGLVFAAALRNGYKVCLSGQGADEVFSDYSMNPHLSTMIGGFPKNLAEWPNFRQRCQRAYLAKEESVAGAFGIETRYPFLDSRVVQEFLWLAPELKNSAYKAPLANYLIRQNFPFAVNRKVGFRAHRSLI